MDSFPPPYAGVNRIRFQGFFSIPNGMPLAEIVRRETSSGAVVLSTGRFHPLTNFAGFNRVLQNQRPLGGNHEC